jgi:endonuclease/exonuclease/phosphatase family metal-dependent hydrolase
MADTVVDAQDWASMATWRVLTWNILGQKRPDLLAVARVIAERNPDGVAVQEVRHSQAKTLAKVLGWQLHWARKHYPYSPLVWWLAEGAAILSPHTLSRTMSASLSPRTSTWTYRHRIVTAATISRDHLPGPQLRVYNVHLSTKNIDDRIAQARRVRGIVDSGPAIATSIAGDLNAANEPDVVRELREAGLDDSGGDVTNPSLSPVQRLDYVLVPRGATVTAVDTPRGGDEWAALSDHLPVLVEFTL